MLHMMIIIIFIKIKQLMHFLLFISLKDFKDLLSNYLFM